MTRRALLSFAAAAVAAAPLAAAKNGKYRARRAARSGPVVFEVASDERFPIRGVDPVLHVGELAVEDYRFGNVENTLLLFTCYQPEELRENAAVYLQYGNDTNSRMDLPPFRWNEVK